jgi:hypothetical protein
LLFVISAFCHIGFLFYRLIDIGFLTVGLFRSAFDLESFKFHHHENDNDDETVSDYYTTAMIDQTPR